MHATQPFGPARRGDCGAGDGDPLHRPEASNHHRPGLSPRPFRPIAEGSPPRPPPEVPFAARQRALKGAAQLQREGAAPWLNGRIAVPCSAPFFPVAPYSLLSAHIFPVIFLSGARLHAVAFMINPLKTRCFLVAD